MNYSLVSFFKNPPITSRRSISSHPLASTSTIRFFKNDVGSSLIFLANDLGVMIDFPHFDWSLIIYSATCLSLLAAESSTSSGTVIFHLVLKCQTSFCSSFSSLLLLSSSPSFSLFLIFLYHESNSLVSFLFFLFLLLEVSGKVWLDKDKFWVLSSRSSTSFPLFPLSKMMLIVDCKFFMRCLLRSEVSKDSFQFLNVWYWLFDLFMDEFTSKESKSCKVSNIAEFLLLK